MFLKSKNLFSLFLFVTVLFTLFSSCAVNPVTGKHELMLISEEDEIRLGERTDREIVMQYGLYEDQKLDAYVKGICRELAKISHRPHLNYQIKIMDTAVINAFAVPGGYIYLTRGILAALNNEAELAGVIGHEMGHITARHSAQQYSKAQLAQLGLGIGSIFIDSPLLMNLGALGVEMLFLKFSRDNEREADRLGVEYASKGGYDASQMVNFFETLNRIEPGSDRSGLPGWFSTHPSPQDRIPMIKIQAKEWQDRLNLSGFKVEKERYFKMIDGLVYGEDPRQGYVSDGVFYHPTLRFQFPIPSMWNVTNKPTQVEIVSGSKDAFIILSISGTPSARDAAKSFVNKTRATALQSGAMEINRMPAYKLISEVRTQDGILKILSCFIEKDNKVYVFHGVSNLKRFQSYYNVFEKTFLGFKELTDPKKINVKPYRIRIRETQKTDSIENILTAFGVPKEKLRENVLINGFSPGQMVSSRTLLKVIERN